jgi:hypothetical protein
MQSNSGKLFFFVANPGENGGLSFLILAGAKPAPASFFWPTDPYAAPLVSAVRIRQVLVQRFNICRMVNSP